jgi:hypothetical protein
MRVGGLARAAGIAAVVFRAGGRIRVCTMRGIVTASDLKPVGLVAARQVRIQGPTRGLEDEDRGNEPFQSDVSGTPFIHRLRPN